MPVNGFRGDGGLLNHDHNHLPRFGLFGGGVSSSSYPEQSNALDQAPAPLLAFLDSKVTDFIDTYNGTSTEKQVEYQQ